ncbi:hypothetical protein nbrc107696_41760 [Gordonia spumicola]|uniref:DUF5050 domain-containing protein n=1 Tax=Gordonia spumicola TaxID=589161 RepID=A0A7I9VFD1_9ACTN|nr:hypothetical protein [Gordonia spumicola]GEE03730.1 hypothetical protein nbrc107696_41760 [Gordonia spumicola]
MRRLWIVIALAAGLTGIVVPPARAALPDLPSNQFTVVNYGVYDLTYLSYTDPDGMLVTRPRSGSVYTPGDAGTWAFKKNIKKHTATLQFVDGDSPIRGQRSSTITLTTSDDSGNNIVHVACAGTGYLCQVRGAAIYLVDDITKFPQLEARSEGDAQQQYDLLKNLCATAGPDCLFTTTTRKATFGDAARITPRTWSSDNGMLYSRTISYTTATTTSFSTTYKVGASYDVFSASVYRKYSTTVTESRTETDDVSFSIPPRLWFWLEEEGAVVRYTGEFTLEVGSGTITLTGVHYDVPDPSRTSLVSAITSPTNPDLDPADDPGYGQSRGSLGSFGSIGRSLS